MKHRFTHIIAVAAIAWAGSAFATPSVQPAGNPTLALHVDSMIVSLRSQAPLTVARVLGLEKTSQLSRLRAGETLPAPLVTVSDVAGFADGRNPASLFRDVGVSITLLDTGEADPALMESVRSEGRWRVSMLGGKGRAARIAGAIAAARGRGASSAHLSLVRVPGLAREFVSYPDAAGNAMMIPVYDDAEHGWTQAHAVPAQEVWTALSAEAARVLAQPE